MMQKQLQRDEVYRWFSELNSSQRVDFICGLLDLSIPLELRFLGSCLEDLARKDYHSLRDSEIKANNVADLASLTNMTDEVVRSKLIVSLALLCSDNREASGVLYRTLTHIDSIINNYGLQLHDRTGDEFLLLFTMASNHPAFTFHQKQVFRQELLEIQRIIDSTSNTNTGPDVAASVTTSTTTAPASRDNNNTTVYKVSHKTESGVNCLENALQSSAHSYKESFQKRPSGKHSKISIERIDVKGLQHKKSDHRIAEYSFEVSWSDSSVTFVVKSLREIKEFLSKLPQVFPEENLDNVIPDTTIHDCSYMEERNHTDLEPYLRYLVSLPSHILKNDHIKKFFCTAQVNHPTQHLHTNSLPVTLHKANSSTSAALRPICGVAGIQCSHNSLQPSLPPTLCSHPVAGSSSSSWPQTENLNPHNVEQIGILDWLKKLRLHKYYPVFQQLTMDKFLSLTEEDLNKFETLTLGAKKKLKTQLELEKGKCEKRHLNSLGQPSVSNSGIARVTPTSHFGPIHSIRCNPAAELRVEVDQQSRTINRDSGSSSDYSSSPSSPMGIQGREESSDSADENEKHVETVLDIPIKEKPAMLTHQNNLSSGSWRPTAQVLPVQNETGLAHPSHAASGLAHTSHASSVAISTVQFMPVISSNIAPSRMLNSVRKSERGSLETKLITGISSNHPNPPELGIKLHEAPPGPGSSIKVEKKFGPLGAMVVDVMPTSLQPSKIATGVSENSSFQPNLGNFGIRATVGPPSSDVPKTTQLPVLRVETSTSTTNSSYHLSHPPMKILVSSSIPSESMVMGQTAYSGVVKVKSIPPAVISSRTVPYSQNTKVAFSTVQCSPVTSIPGTFCGSNNAPANNHTSVSFTNIMNVPNCPAPSSSPSLSSVVDNGYINSNNGGSGSGVSIPMQQQTGCNVCSSCGCSGNCGSNPVTINYASYFQNPFSGPSVLTFPLFPISPLCNNGYISTQQYNNTTAFPYPVVPSPVHNNGLSPDTLISGQSGFVLPPMQNFLGGTTTLYQTQSMVGSTNGSGHKKNGNISCYNCGANGHRAQDCKQPAMDSNQQGTFRLKYAPPSESVDSAD